jgi:hypothetical protein
MTVCASSPRGLVSFRLALFALLTRVMCRERLGLQHARRPEMLLFGTVSAAQTSCQNPDARSQRPSFTCAARVKISRTHMSLTTTATTETMRIALTMQGCLSRGHPLCEAIGTRVGILRTTAADCCCDYYCSHLLRIPLAAAAAYQRRRVA